jgi:hypothetical protein
MVEQAASAQQLRKKILQFYELYNPENAEKVDKIFEKYKDKPGDLWPQLMQKYQVPASEARQWFKDLPNQSQLSVLGFELPEAPEEFKTMKQKDLCDWASGQTNLAVAKAAVFDGATVTTRPVLWRVLLGMAPPGASANVASCTEKRALYTAYLRDFSPHSEPDLMQEIQNDVVRTHQDEEFFRADSVREAMCRILFVFAKLNRAIRYVQGMNEILAVLYFVYSQDASDWREHAEPDAFWSFTALIMEFKDHFLGDLDKDECSVNTDLNEISGLLYRHAPDVHKHLRRQNMACQLFALRWVTTLLSREFYLKDTIRIWDPILADPQRFQFLLFVCLAILLALRDVLLANEEFSENLVVLQAETRHIDVDKVLSIAHAVCSYERRGCPGYTPPMDWDEVAEWAQEASAGALESARSARPQQLPQATRRRCSRRADFWTKPVRSQSSSRRAGSG